jgi:hypothetical protein
LIGTTGTVFVSSGNGFGVAGGFCCDGLAGGFGFCAGGGADCAQSAVAAIKPHPNPSAM